MAGKPVVRVKADGSVAWPDGTAYQLVPARQALEGEPDGTRVYALPMGDRPYEAARRNQRQFAGWTTRLGQVDREHLGDRPAIVGRARELVRNNPIISGGMDRRAEAVVGSRIRLQAMPDWEAMGRDWKWAGPWARNVESQFRVWGLDSRRLCDAERTQTLGQMIDTAYRHWWTDGEAMAYIEMRDRGSAYQTCVRLIDPDRLGNPIGKQDEEKLANGNQIIGGVEIDPSGAPVAYHVRKNHPDAREALSVDDTVRIPREDADARPRLIHAFRRKRAQQRRGVSRLVASMRTIKTLQRYDEAELELAILRALRAPYLRTKLGTDEARDLVSEAPDAHGYRAGYAEDWLAFREENPLMIEGVGFTTLLPEEEIGFAEANGPPAHYADFRQQGLRSIATDFGLSEQQLIGNWDEINFSSARTLLNEIWRGLLDDRWQFTQMFCTPIYSAWLQEAVAIGKVKLPGGPAAFFRYRAELTMAQWLGPGRGVIDPKKESDGNDGDLSARRSSLTVQMNERGLDVRDTFMDLAREAEMRAEFGLKDLPKEEAAIVGDGEEEGDDE